MINTALKTIIERVKKGEINDNELYSLISKYAELGLKKNDLRKIVSVYEKFLMKDKGILGRETSNEIKDHLKKTYGLTDIFSHESNSVDQTLKIQDTIYTFKVKDKLQKLIS